MQHEPRAQVSIVFVRLGHDIAVKQLSYVGVHSIEWEALKTDQLSIAEEHRLPIARGD